MALLMIARSVPDRKTAVEKNDLDRDSDG